MIDFKGIRYRIGLRGLVFRLKNNGNIEEPDDWLRSTVTEKELNENIRLVEEQAKKAQLRKARYSETQKNKKLRKA